MTTTQNPQALAYVSKATVRIEFADGRAVTADFTPLEGSPIKAEISFGSEHVEDEPMRFGDQQWRMVHSGVPKADIHLSGGHWNVTAHNPMDGLILRRETPDPA